MHMKPLTKFSHIKQLAEFTQEIQSLQVRLETQCSQERQSIQEIQQIQYTQWLQESQESQ